MPKGHYRGPARFGSSLYKSAATVIVYQETVGAVTWVIAIDGTTHAVISRAVLAVSDATVVNAALVYLNALGGGSCFVDEGTYTMLVTITMFSSVLLYGVEGATHFTTEIEDHLITVNGIDSFTIEMLLLSHTLAAGNFECISVDDSDRWYINRVRITDGPRFGIGTAAGTTMTEGWVVDCHISGTGWEGIIFFMAAGELITNLFIMGNYIADTSSGSPIGVSRAERPLIANNITEGTGGSAGIYVNAGTSTIVADNIIDDNTGAGIYIDGGDNASITGNTVYSASAAGARLQNLENSVFDGNSIYEAVTDGLIMNTCVNCSATDNMIQSSGDDGIALNANCDYNHIHGNNLVDSTGYGINITAGATENDCRDNHYYSNTAGCINDLGTDTRVHEKSVEAPNPNSNVGRHATMQMLDGVATVVRYEVPTPNNLYELVTAQVVVIPGGTGNLAAVALADYGRICHDETYNTHDGSVDYLAGNVIAVTADELECIDVSGALASMTAHDWVGSEFIRYGGEAVDTIGAKVDFVGFRLRYV